MESIKVEYVDIVECVELLNSTNRVLKDWALPSLYFSYLQG